MKEARLFSTEESRKLGNRNRKERTAQVSSNDPRLRLGTSLIRLPEVLEPNVRELCDASADPLGSPPHPRPIDPPGFSEMAPGELLLL